MAKKHHPAKFAAVNRTGSGAATKTPTRPTLVPTASEAGNLGEATVIAAPRSAVKSAVTPAQKTAAQIAAKKNTLQNTTTVAQPPARSMRAAQPQRSASKRVSTVRSEIRAEDYAYVLKDLQFILIMAAVIFIFLVVLHFFLP